MDRGQEAVTMSEEISLNMNGGLTPLIAQLEDAIAIEHKFQAHLKLPSAEHSSAEHSSAEHSSANHTTTDADVTAAIRDGSAHVLRCLKVWYDLPADVLFSAVNFMDRFLSKMKAQPKHMACISVSCFHLAAAEVARQGGPSLDLRDLSVISQCNCTPGDLERMERIVFTKLGIAHDGLPMTPLSFLRIYHELFLASDLGPVFKEILAAGSRGGDIWQCLEIVVCDATCANFRPSVVALVVLYTQLQLGLEESSAGQSCSELVRLVAFAVQLQKVSKIPGSTFSACLEAVMAVVRRYNSRTQLPYRQQLVWKVSTRTMRVLRPTDRYTLALPTINEQLDHRSRSGSFSSEEGFESKKEEMPKKTLSRRRKKRYQPRMTSVL